MTFNDFIQIMIYVILLILLSPILGKYFYNVFCTEKNILTPVFRELERFIYRLIGVDVKKEMDWKKYTLSLLIFNLIGIIILMMILLFQKYLPLNTERAENLTFHLAFNTAVSFVTNTNWQSYAGETTLSYFSQMAGLGVQNFLSAASGITVFLALTRGFVKRQGMTIGNFWSDLTKSILYVLLPLSIILSIFLMSQGVIQNFNSYKVIPTINGDTQILPMGPAASQIAIKQLGTNGGGFFNTNASHPFENPTPFSNLLEMLSLLLIPAALVFTYGYMTTNKKHALILFWTMMILFIIGLGFSLLSEYNMVGTLGGMMEGKETRFGIINSILYSVATTCASNGSINAMHSSLSPLSGMIAMINMMLGEIIFGGVGSGLYGMILFVMVTVFIAGLMVGRTPEYLGKKIEALDIKMASIGILVPCAVILIFTSLSLSIKWGTDYLSSSASHGLSEMLYAFTSAAGNNGSAFAGINANSPYLNYMIGLGMLIGRFGIIFPVLAIAGNMVKKNVAPESAGTFKTDNWIFLILLIAVIIIIGALTFFPSLSIGPIAEHLLIKTGRAF